MKLLQDEIEEIKEVVKRNLKKNIDNVRAFIFLDMYHYYFSEERLGKVVYDIDEMITDGSNDGGIDFVYFDEDNSKIVLGQCKSGKNISNNDIVSVLNQMNSTIENFINGKYSGYNEKLKNVLQNTLDRLSDDDKQNVEYHIFIGEKINIQSLNKAIDKASCSSYKDAITIYQLEDISSTIIENKTKPRTIKKFQIEIDDENNMLRYNNKNTSGAVVNMKSTSLSKMYSMYKRKGIFDLNIRGYIKNKIVDSGINKTLDSDRDNFWFYNNGIIISCDSYEVEGNKISLHQCSIVNGGQTTKLIGEYNGHNDEEFYIQCKIVSPNKENIEEFSTKIATTTNSQKPTYPRDLRSNSREMKYLKSKLAEKQILLEIKRGVKEDRTPYSYSIKNDELGQIILSFVYQSPGTSRSSKKKIFENDTFYSKIYKTDYFTDKDKENFILDIVELDKKFESIYDELKLSPQLEAIEKEILKNGKQIIFALLGLLYDIVNNPNLLDELMENVEKIRSHEFVYSAIFSDRNNSQLDEKLKSLIINLLEIVSDLYTNELENGRVSSVSNYFKTDQKYRNSIIKPFIKEFRRSKGQEIKKISEEIFNRKNS